MTLGGVGRTTVGLVLRSQGKGKGCLPFGRPEPDVQAPHVRMPEGLVAIRPLICPLV